MRPRISAARCLTWGRSLEKRLRLRWLCGRVKYNGRPGLHLSRRRQWPGLPGWPPLPIRGLLPDELPAGVAAGRGHHPARRRQQRDPARLEAHQRHGPGPGPRAAGSTCMWKCMAMSWATATAMEELARIIDRRAAAHRCGPAIPCKTAALGGVLPPSAASGNGLKVTSRN